MSDAEKPPPTLELIWEHDLVFAGRRGAARMTLDSASAAGPSPMDALAFGLAGCMAMDVVYVLKKGRHDLRGLRVDLRATRAPEPPRRFTALMLHFTVTATVAPEYVERAIQLSRDKYCSVWHSLREDMRLDTSYVIDDGH